MDSLKLTFTQGSYLFSDTVFTPSLPLASDETRTVDFAVTVRAGSTPGNSTINAAVFGRGS
nr:hypothetical protein [Fodinibius sp.]